MSSKLYRVTCRGMKSSHGMAYVVARDPGEAYSKVRESLDDRDLGFDADREMEKVELLAEQADYPECKTSLYC